MDNMNSTFPFQPTAAQPLHVKVTPTVIAFRSSDRFNVSCGVENGQKLHNAEYQFFHNGAPIDSDAPRSSSLIMVPATSTGNFTCNVTQYSDQRTPISSVPSPPVQAIVLSKCLIHLDLLHMHYYNIYNNSE